MILPAISIKEPWSSLIANGQKTIEIRSWKTKRRGPIILCSSKAPKGRLSGNAFALADIIDVRPMKPQDSVHSCCDFLDGHFSWVLSNIRPFNPFPIKGRLGFYSIDTKLKSVVPSPN